MERRTNILPCNLITNHITNKATDTVYGLCIGMMVEYVLGQTMLTVNDVDSVKQKIYIANEYTKLIMRDKEPYNEQGNRHGYWEVYSSDKLRYFKRNYVNGVRLGIEENKSSNALILIYNAR